jgi:glycosyltransferase A (GT-A) superfamily protein (DUF2064 family)
MVAKRLREAFADFRANDVVIGQAEDGGSYLLGTRNLVSEIFQSIPCRTERVLELTLEVIAIGACVGGDS